MHHHKSADLLHLIRLQSHLASGQAVEPSLEVSEGAAIYAAVEGLLGENNDVRVDVVKGFLLSEGEIHGVPCKLSIIY